MRRVTISHCEFRRGYAVPSRFLADIPKQHRVTGWLRDAPPVPTPCRHPPPQIDRVSAAELLRRF